MKKAAFIAIGVLVSIVCIGAASGGFPSIARFQAVGINTAPPPAGRLKVSGPAASNVQTASFTGTTTGANYMGWINDGGTSYIGIEAEGGNSVTIGGTSYALVLNTVEARPILFGTNNALKATLLNGLVMGPATGADKGAGSINVDTGYYVDGVALEASGTFTATFDDACTTSPAVTFDWDRVGNIVTVAVTSQGGFPCTGDSTGFVTTGTPIPAAIRPTAVSPMYFRTNGGLTNNGAAVDGCIGFESGGNVRFGAITTFGNSCQPNAWTAAGSRSATSVPGTTFSYIINNP